MDTIGIFINGRSEIEDRTYDLRSPYNGELIAKIGMADEGDVKRAIDGAQKTYETMKELPTYKRSGILTELKFVTIKTTF